ncbi:MAG: membrane protein insertion efficiency factor YidD [Planctomycetota bacterium]
MTWARALAALPIRFYRRFLSPLKPPTCRFYPTCSAYGLQALRVHGVLKGGLLTAWRILRCQPLGTRGFDPVPAPGRWRPEIGPRARGRKAGGPPDSAPRSW